MNNRETNVSKISHNATPGTIGGAIFVRNNKELPNDDNAGSIVKDIHGGEIGEDKYGGEIVEDTYGDEIVEDTYGDEITAGKYHKQVPTSDRHNPNVTEILPIKYKHRDISWMDFNRRILDLAKCHNTPLGERLKFLSITNSNLDEFIMVRIGGMLGNLDNINVGEDGMTSAQRYKYLRKDVRSFIKEQSAVLMGIYDEFKNNGIRIIKPEMIESKGIKNWVKDYYEDKIAGLITPIVFDNSRPFPLLKTKELNIGVLIKDGRTGDNMFGTIQVPDVDRLVEVRCKELPENERFFMFVEDIIAMNLSKIFINKEIEAKCYYRILRNFDDKVDNNKNDSFLTDEMKKSLKRRESGQTVCIQISNNKKNIAKILQKSLNVDKDFLIKIDNVVDPSIGFSINKYMSDEDKEKMLYTPFQPQSNIELVGESNILDIIDRGDVMLHHPFESFDAVVNFISQAADDPSVYCIKQTLYRVSNNSPIMDALIRAAEKGKQVIVLLEIKARFNEKENIEWANKLQMSGGHVIYGVDGLKTHCKMTLVTKKTKKDNLKQYAHIGTGNYNDSTAKIYTDVSLFTADSSICKEINKLFNTLTGFSEPSLSRIISSPYHMRAKIIEMIHNEINNKKNNKPAKIVMKVNSLTDIKIIDALYEAGDAGVEVDLIVRGACSLLKSDKQSIRVISVVGRFLEHSRIFYFQNANDKERLFIASADMMDRNLDKRFEIMVPIYKKGIVKKLKSILEDYTQDESAYEMQSDGTYKQRVECSEESTQLKYMHDNNELANVKNISKVFIRQK